MKLLGTTEGQKAARMGREDQAPGAELFCKMFALLFMENPTATSAARLCVANPAS